MSVLNALRETPDTLQRNPVLFVPVLVVMLFQVPQLVLQTVNPFLASVTSFAFSLVFLFVMPFFQGGIIGMADEALDGRTSLDTFLHDGKANYVSLLLAYFVLIAINFALGFVAFFAAIPVGFAFYSGLGSGVGLVVIAIVGLFAVLVGLTYLLFVFFIQFYAQAIVIDDDSAVDGFKRSIAIVRRNLVSTLGYSVVVGVLGAAVGVVSSIGFVLASPQSVPFVSLPSLSVAGTVGVALGVFVVGSLFAGFFGVFSVAFYRTTASANDGTRNP